MALLAAASLGCAATSAPPPRPARPAPPPRVAAIEPEAAPEPPDDPIDEAIEEREDVATPPPPAAGEPANLAAPSPLATIQPTTPPHVAAATRLADQARLHMAQGDADGAIELLERAVAVDPANPYAYYFLAEIHFARGAYDQAIHFAERAALLSARAPTAWLSRSYALEGRIFEAAGAFTEARDAYRQALEADGGNAGARAGMARVGGGAR